MLFFEQRKDELENVFCDDPVSCGGGVGVVVLHQAIAAVDALEEEGKHGYLIFFSEQDVGLVELTDVVRSVVGGQGDSCKYDFGSGGLERFDDVVEICT